MKSLRKMLMVGLLCVLAGVSARAQVGIVDEKFAINIPFNFYVGGKEFAAGEYAVKRMNSNGLCYVIRRSDGQKTDLSTVSIFIVSRRERARVGLPSSLVFQVSEGQHHLAQVWDAGSNYGGEVKVKAQNRQLAGAAQSQTVTLIAEH